MFAVDLNDVLEGFGVVVMRVVVVVVRVVKIPLDE